MKGGYMYKYLQSTSVGTHSTRSKRPRLSRCVTLLLLYFCSPTAGRVYYVDNQNGLDENTGILENAAWQTLSKVSRTTFQAGDTVKMKCGSSWTGQSLTINGTGAETSPILFTSYGDGAAPRLGGLTSAQGNGINVRGSRVILEKIMVSDVVQSGCWVTGSHVTIRAIEICGEKIAL